MNIALPIQWILDRPTGSWYGLLLILCLLTVAARAQTPLNLPFFDDFSTTSFQPGVSLPDPARWEPGSGVYLNNTLAINHPTVGVASFDGLRANGRAYIQNNQFAQGYTDTLQSRPITLAGLSAGSSVYLSFYYQLRGLGELPDPGDSLTVQFRNQAGAWVTVWQVENAGDSLKIRSVNANGVWQTDRQVNGSNVGTTFSQAFIPILNSNFFHANFAFRFRAYGRGSGPFDTWNIDYVYLNKGRQPSQEFVVDAAARRALSPLLKRFTAMPLSQYAVNPAAEMADSVTTDIKNLNNGFNNLSYKFSIRDEVTGRIIQNDPLSAAQLIDPLGVQQKGFMPKPVTGLEATGRAVLRYTFFLNTTDNEKPSIPGVDLRQNDTLSAVAVLADYYAYDDGSWEFGQQIGIREQVAVRFILNKPDVVAGVRACIVPFLTNQANQSFVINVYSNRNGRPGPVLYQKSFRTQYPATRNGFVSFPFDRGVSVKDTFYVGYQQISSSDTTRLRLGFDKNSPFGNQIFYNGGTNWEQNGQSAALNVRGAFMLRPVMGGKPDTVVTATPEPVPLAPLTVYPNPTTGLVRWDNPQVTRLEVLNSAGRFVVLYEPTRGQQTVDLSHLPNGLYLLRLSDSRRTVVQKLIVQH